MCPGKPDPDAPSARDADSTNEGAEAKDTSRESAQAPAPSRDEAENEDPQPRRKQSLIYWVSTVCAVLVGGAFVVAGALKVFDPFSFYTQIRNYRLVGAELSKILAFVLPPFEIALGLAVMVGLWRRLACLGLIGMLLIFMVATGHAWIYGTTDNCGCFGELISRSPKATFIEDSVMLVFALAGLLGKTHLEKLGRFRIRPWMKLTTVLLVGVISAGLSVLSGSLAISIKGKLKPGLDASEWPVSELDTPAYKKKGFKINLEKGTHVLVVYAPLCKHCYSEIPEVAKMHRLLKKKGLAKVAGLSHDLHRPGWFRFFIKGMKSKGADYPLLSMPYSYYRNLNRTVPKTVIIKTGVVRYVIDGVPKAEQLVRLLD